MRHPRVAVAWTLLAAAMVAGCHRSTPPDNTFLYAAAYDSRGDQSPRFNFVGGPDAGASIQMPEGAASALSIQLISQSHGVLQGTITSADPGILQVIPLSDGTGYGFLASTAGATNVVITINGQTVQTIPATVQPPPASSIPPGLDAGALAALQLMDLNPPNAAGTTADDASASEADADEPQATDSSPVEGTDASVSPGADATQDVAPDQDASVDAD